MGGPKRFTLLACFTEWLVVKGRETAIKKSLGGHMKVGLTMANFGSRSQPLIVLNPVPPSLGIADIRRPERGTWGIPLFGR